MYLCRPSSLQKIKIYFFRIAAIISSEIRAIKPSSPIIDKIEEKLDTTDPNKAVSGPKIIPTNNETATNKAKTSVTLYRKFFTVSKLNQSIIFEKARGLMKDPLTYIFSYLSNCIRIAAAKSPTIPLSPNVCMTCLLYTSPSPRD